MKENIVYFLLMVFIGLTIYYFMNKKEKFSNVFLDKYSWANIDGYGQPWFQTNWSGLEIFNPWVYQNTGLYSKKTSNLRLF
jgi:hypothetical protein